MPLYSYHCFHCSEDCEKLVRMSDRDLPQKCEVCGNMLERKIDAPRAKLDPISGDFPDATRQWEKRRADQLARENRVLAEHGSLNGYTEETS